MSAGFVDILAWHSLTRTLLIIELKTEVPDPAGLLAQVDRYRRLAPAIGRARVDPLRVATWVFVAESDLNRRQVARHNVMLRNAFPRDRHSVRRWLRDPSAGSVLGRVVGASAVPSRIDGLSFLAYAAGDDTNGRFGPTKRVSRRRATPGAASSLVKDAQSIRMRGKSGFGGRLGASCGVRGRSRGISLVSLWGSH